MGRKKTFVKTAKLPQAQSAEEIEARDKLHDQKEKARAGRRVDCDDKPKKKKKGDGEESDEESDDGSEDGMFEHDEPEEDDEEEEEEKAKKPKTLMDQLGVQLEGATNLNVAAKGEKKAVSAKKMDVSGGDKPELSRREREAMDAQRKSEAYRKKHAAGETDEAKADLARLTEVRRKREEAKKQRDAESADTAEGEKAEEASKKSVAKKEKVVLTTPTQKDIKSALINLQESASDEFQKKHKLVGLSGNKLAKMKYSDFMKIWQDFVDNASDAEHREYAA